MANKKRFTTEQFLKAIPQTGGVIASIAKEVGCERHTASKYINDNAKIQQAYIDETETTLDLAEHGLHKLIQQGDFQAIKFYLSTKGKGRGYREARDVDVTTDGKAITSIRVIWDEHGSADTSTETT